MLQTAHFDLKKYLKELSNTAFVVQFHEMLVRQKEKQNRSHHAH